MSRDALEDMLYYGSGLKGLSGISGDVRVLAESEAPAAEEALAIFAFRVAREVAALAATLGGLDALVFTGGIGEHHPAIRARICDRLAWLGVICDSEANDAGNANISSPDAGVAVMVIAANEEQAMADQSVSILAQARRAS
jgi:acetate kinase